MPKKFTYQGKTVQELKQMPLKEFIKLLPARKRRSINRGFTDAQKLLLEKIKKTNQVTYKKQIKTHIRDMVIIQEMINQRKS